MLNQLKAIETNLKSRLETKRTLRRMERFSENPAPLPAEDREQAAPSPLPPESVYFIIELA
jgi:hypothetical protein